MYFTALSIVFCGTGISALLAARRATTCITVTLTSWVLGLGWYRQPPRFDWQRTIRSTAFLTACSSSGSGSIPYISAMHSVVKPCEYIGPDPGIRFERNRPLSCWVRRMYFLARSSTSAYGPRPGTCPRPMIDRIAIALGALQSSQAPSIGEPSRICTPAMYLTDRPRDPLTWSMMSVSVRMSAVAALAAGFLG